MTVDEIAPVRTEPSLPDGPAPVRPDPSLPDGPAPLPGARGPVSAALLRAVSRDPGRSIDLRHFSWEGAAADACTDDDLQLALWLSYELHYRGLAGVDERWEWHPELLWARGALGGAAAWPGSSWPCRGPQPWARSAGRRRGRPRRRWPRPTASRRCRSTCCASATAEQFARVPRAPFDLPPQGGGPAQLGDPAAERGGQGRPHRPSRPTSTAAGVPAAMHAAAVPGADGATGGSTPRTAATSTGCRA